ncbi:hypothetical protein HIM_09169 [Hirsutella minnesotensis 3608]|uniref:Peptidase A1 domain-containing protein n=1 Tax=Hirsutella minnesotensis 3608 TaxID=1043627 RepID=A0A0F7ZLT2_9HYPO|nr:hypothetical protein HIM_09169 [Hirsutella minnesotensis 3608]
MLAILGALAALPLVAHAAIDLLDDNRMVQRDGMIRYPITVRDGAPAKDRLFRRQTDVALASQKTGFFYSIEVKLGTPPQAVSVNLDTGSDELWVNPMCNKSTDPTFCQSFGRFNGSQTFVDVKRNSTIQYGTGFAELEYGYDFVQIGAYRLSQQLLGVATDSEFAVTGILGAGPNLDGWNSHYPTVIDNMAKQGFIKSRAFSLDIRSLESKRGSVVFGGIDTKKFSGHLEKLPIVPPASAPDGQTRYWVWLDGISVHRPNGSVASVYSKPKGQAVLLDSGYTISTLPSVIFDKLLAAFPEAKAPKKDSKLYEIPCSLGKVPGHIDFKFGKTTINVPFNDFIWYQTKSKICVLGASRDDDFPVLGDTFLRAAYVVHDWDNRNIHIANNEDCGSHLLPIGKGPDSVPSVKGECGVKPTSTASPPMETGSPIRGNDTVVTKSPVTTPLLPVPTSSWLNSTLQSDIPPYTSEPYPVQTGSPIELSGVPPYGYNPPSFGPEIPTESGLPKYPKNTLPYGSVVGQASTFTSTTVYTITACPPGFINCPVGAVTTETVIGETAATTISSVTSYVYSTSTVIRCHGTAPCGNAQPTTKVIQPTAHEWSQTTATFTIPRTHTCTQGENGCTPGEKIISTHIVTIKPVTTALRPTPVPGCDNCRMPPPAAVTPVARPPGPAQIKVPGYRLPPAPPAVAPVPQPPAQVPEVGPGNNGFVARPTAPPCITCGSAGYVPPVVTAGAAQRRVSAFTVALALFAIAL